MIEIRQVHIDRYVTPLREGGSLPAIVEADDGFMYVLKFRGAGQGCKALIADLIGGELARALGFRVPEIVFGDLPEGYGRTEPDEEIQDLLKWSTGLNLGLHYLQGAITFDPITHGINEKLASQIVWLDAFLMNIDRTVRNTNMLFWKSELWLIDHGASLYFHHQPENWEKAALSAFAQIKEHVLLSKATQLKAIHEVLLAKLTDELLKEIVDLIPVDWLESDPGLSHALYLDFLKTRRNHASAFLNEAIHARETRL
jgi:hypothetical protein